MQHAHARKAEELGPVYAGERGTKHTEPASDAVVSAAVGDKHTKNKAGQGSTHRHLEQDKQTYRQFTVEHTNTQQAKRMDKQGAGTPQHTGNAAR